MSELAIAALIMRVMLQVIAVALSFEIGHDFDKFASSLLIQFSSSFCQCKDILHISVYLSVWAVDGPQFFSLECLSINATKRSSHNLHNNNHNDRAYQSHHHSEEDSHLMASLLRYY